MKFLLCLLLAHFCATAVWSFPTTFDNVPSECVDPTYACQDIETARLCKVVKSCIHDVWSTMSAPDDNDEICDICKEMVKEARDQLLSNMTQEEIKEVFEGSCKLLPVKLIADACIKLVDEFIPELVEMLASRMDPNMVCTVSGLCNLAHLPIKDSVKNKGKVQDELVCEFCTHVLQHIKDEITANTTVEEFRTALLNFCKHTGSFSNKCTDLVNEYYDTFFGYIRSMNPKGFCTLITLCNNGQSSKNVIPAIKIMPALKVEKVVPMTKLVPSQKMDNSNDVQFGNEIIGSQSQLPIERLSHPLITFERDTECAFCRAVSFYMMNDLAGDRNEVNVERALKNVCGKWVSEYPDHCGAFISKYSQTLKKHIVKGTEYDSLCTAMKACIVTENNNDLSVKVISPTSYPFCDPCKDAFNEIENYLKDPSAKKNTEEFLDRFCTYLPKSVQDDCKTMINQNVDALFNILEQELVGSNVCPALGLCPGSYKKPKNFKSIECDLCKDFVQQLQNRMQDPDVKQSLKDLLDRSCSVLPTELANECKTFVDQNIDNLINVLVQDMDPGMICSAVKLCDGSVNKQGFKVKDFECDVCKEVVQKVDDELKDQRTEEEIKEALEKVCSYMPSSLANECKTFVDKYSEMLITLLAAEMDPNVICAALKICPGSLITPPHKPNDLECDLCKEVVQKIDDDLKDQRTEVEIREALDKVCSYLPSSFSERCKSFVDKYSDMLITLLATEMDPGIVCGALKVCPENSEKWLQWSSKAKNFECVSCQYVFHFVQNQLMDSQIQDSIKDDLKKICKALPAEYSNNCIAYIDEFGSSLLTIIAQYLDPSTVCYSLHACENVNATRPKQMINSKLNLDECSLCTTVVDYLDKLLEEDDVDKEITQLIEKVCSVIPSTMKNKCSILIETYGPYLLQMIGQLADSKQVCQDIDMCPRTSGHVHLLGGRKCTFGPSYWCKSKAHAAACKAEEYCFQKEWSK